MSRARKRKVGDRSDAYQRIYAVVDSIPRGRVATYGQVAREAGMPRNARQVGFALRTLPEGSPLPWHRVLNAKGEISERACASGGPRVQLQRLKREGVETDARGRIDLERFGWRPDW